MLQDYTRDDRLIPNFPLARKMKVSVSSDIKRLSKGNYMIQMLFSDLEEYLNLREAQRDSEERQKISDNILGLIERIFLDMRKGPLKK